MKILHCNLCVKQGRVECKPEDLMQVKMTGKIYCKNNHVLQSRTVSMIPAIRFYQRHLDEPLDKLLQIVKNNPQEAYISYSGHTERLDKALEKENSSDGNL